MILYKPRNADYIVALKNADDLLQDVIKAMDKDGDKVISYEGALS